MSRLVLIAVLLFLSACGRGVPDGARIVVAGDSVMAWNRVEGQSVATVLSRRLGEPVGDVSLPFARVMADSGPAALDIRRQVAGLTADWIVLDGGANDIGVGCSCPNCGAVVDRLVSADGRTGAIPDMVRGMRARRARVIWADYYTSPKYAGTSCQAVYDRLGAGLQAMAAGDAGVFLVDMAPILPPTDRGLFDADAVHPSPRGSARIADLVAERLRQVDRAIAR